jgi:Pyruvate/2-oxoacid:ferredoxin oxidoreductase gamma subunit
MLGAIAKTTDWVELESLFTPIKHTFPGRIGDLNIQACKMGYELVKEVVI